MLTRKRFLFTLQRDRSGYRAAGWYWRPFADRAWKVVLYHCLPVPFFVEIGWAPRGWYTADSADAAAKLTLDDFRPGEQGEGFSDEWDRLDAEEQETLA